MQVYPARLTSVGIKASSSPTRVSNLSVLSSSPVLTTHRGRPPNRNPLASSSVWLLGVVSHQPQRWLAWCERDALITPPSSAWAKCRLHAPHGPLTYNHMDGLPSHLSFDEDIGEVAEDGDGGE